MVHCYTRGLGSSAFARHYSRNHCYFLFLRVLRCFSSPRSPGALRRDGIAAAGFPHSDIGGSAGICPLPPLFAACHVLLRLREPKASPMRPYLLSFFFSPIQPVFLVSSLLVPLREFLHSMATLSILDSISKLSRILSVSHRIHLFIYVCRFACPSCQ